MPTFDPGTLAVWTGGRWSSQPGAPLTGFSADSRRLAPGQVFVALKTSKRDGHAYLAEALKAGASAAYTSRIVGGVDLPQLVVRDPLEALQTTAREHRKGFKGTVIGITGSAGKTSTKELLSALLGGESGRTLSTEGNLNNHIGVALTLTRIDPSLHRFAVVEAGISGPGEMGVLARMIQPDAVIVTLLAPAHLEGLGGVEGVAREKAVLAVSVGEKGTCIFPSSCRKFAAFRDIPAQQSLVVEPVSDLDAATRVRGTVPFSVVHSWDHTRICICVGGRSSEFTVQRVTDGMAQNVALAICAAVKLGIERGQIRDRLLDWRPAPLRGEWRVSEGRRLYLDCYNANPASMADALSAFMAVAPQSEPRLFILGCMEELGPDAPRYHSDLGRSLRLGKEDLVVAVGGLAEAIREGALEAGADPDQVTVSGSIDPLIERLSTFKGAVFIKGSRRHQLEKAFSGPVLAASSHA